MEKAWNILIIYMFQKLHDFRAMCAAQVMGRVILHLENNCCTR